MTCPACKHQYCFQCNEPWETHGGGYFFCEKTQKANTVISGAKRGTDLNLNKEDLIFQAVVANERPLSYSQQQILKSAPPGTEDTVTLARQFLVGAYKALLVLHATKKQLLAAKPAIHKQKARIQGVVSKVENSVRAWTSGFGVSFSDMPLDEMVMRGARYVTAVTKELLYPDRAPEYNDPSIKRERELFGHGYYWDGVSFTNVDPTAAKKKIGRLSAKQLKRRERLEKSRPVRGSGRRNGKGQVVHSRWRW
eukprot:INCI5121.3.p1 GENE.INCI5121.3~~INCI5121.3.p1  ORF type:complete len:252 (+),score=31.84 INCI5121.3:181-936(+)